MPDGYRIVRICGVEHPTRGRCSLPKNHRGAHRVTRIVTVQRYDYFGTNEAGYDPVTGAPLADQSGSNEHPSDRGL